MIANRVEILLRIFSYPYEWHNDFIQGYIHYLDDWDSNLAAAYYEELVAYIQEIWSENNPNA